LSNSLYLQKNIYVSTSVLFEDQAAAWVPKEVYPGSYGAQASWKNNACPPIVGKISLFLALCIG
jgi:hypothetical protein